ncbi:MAG: hypothetical protein ABI147_14555 [Acidobacteriaceae bacterium]
MLALAACAFLAINNFRLRKTVTVLTTQLHSVQIAHGPAVGSHLLRLQGIDLTGKPRIFNFPEQNQPALLFVLAPKCTFCNRMLPVWKHLAEAISPDNVIYADVSETIDEAYLDSAGIVAAKNVIMLDQTEQMTHGFRGTPTTLVVDRSGKILRSWAGIMDEKQVEDFNRALLSLN